MSDEKKYTAQEAGLAVLKKAEEMLKAHKHIGWGKLHGKLEREGYSKESADKIAGAIKAKVHPAHKSEEMDKHAADGDGGKIMPDKMKKSAESAKENMPKKASAENEPEKSDKAFETKPGHEKTGDPRLNHQEAPGNNPKEQAEGNNELAGTTPTQVGQDGKNKPGYDEMKGYLKLTKFMGRMEHKRNQGKKA